jgi:hypothetical protein
MIVKKSRNELLSSPGRENDATASSDEVCLQRNKDKHKKHSTICEL